MRLWIAAGGGDPLGEAFWQRNGERLDALLFQRGSRDIALKTDWRRVYLLEVLSRKDLLLDMAFQDGSFRARQQSERLRPRQYLAGGCGKDRQQADLGLGVPHRIPRHPHAIGCAELRGTVMGGELFRSIGHAAVRLLVVIGFFRVVKAIDDELSLDRDCFILGIVEVEPPAESPGRFLAGRAVHRR